MDEQKNPDYMTHGNGDQRVYFSVNIKAERFPFSVEGSSEDSFTVINTLEEAVEHKMTEHEVTRAVILIAKLVRARLNEITQSVEVSPKGLST